MSVDCTAWAWRQEISDARCKLVLLVLADHAGQDWTCWPGTARVAEWAGCGITQVRHWLDVLETDGLITRTRRRRTDGKLSTYEYQLVQHRPTGAGEPSHPRPTDAGPDTAHRVAEPSVNEPSVKKDTSSSDDDVDLQFEFNFAEFWKMYPRKTGKPAAKKVLRRLWSKGHLAMEDAPAVIATGLAKWVEYWNAERTEQKFVPHPATWLNQRRWEDLPPTAKTAEATGPAVPHAHYTAFMSGLPFFEEYAPRIANDPQQRIRVLEAVATVARWGYAPGETMVRLAILARWEDLTAIMTPSKIANVPKVDRFTGMPEQNQNDPPGLVASMRRAYQLQQWKHWEQ